MVLGFGGGGCSRRLLVAAATLACLLTATDEISMSYDEPETSGAGGADATLAMARRFQSEGGTGRGLLTGLFAGMLGGNSTGGTNLLKPSQFLNLGINNTAGLLQLLGAKLLLSAFALSVAAAIAGLAVGVATAPALKRTSDYGDLPEEKHDYWEHSRSMPSARQLGILEWIEVLEEVYRKTDRKNPECFERLLCEMHQSSKLQGLARGIDGIANYIMMAKTMVLQGDLPLEASLDGLFEAMVRGQQRGTDCSRHYGSCQLSIREIGVKYFRDVPLEGNSIDEEEILPDHV